MKKNKWNAKPEEDFEKTINTVKTEKCRKQYTITLKLECVDKYKEMKGEHPS